MQFQVFKIDQSYILIVKMFLVLSIMLLCGSFFLLFSEGIYISNFLCLFCFIFFIIIAVYSLKKLPYCNISLRESPYKLYLDHHYLNISSLLTEHNIAYTNIKSIEKIDVFNENKGRITQVLLKYHNMDKVHKIGGFNGDEHEIYFILKKITGL